MYVPEHGTSPTVTLEDVHAFLAEYLRVDRFPDDPVGILRAREGPVARLGLALDPGPGLRAWVRRERLDALLLHRPWGLEPESLGEGIGVLAYHLAFDDRMTLGHNPRLADACGIPRREPAPEVNGRTIGLVGDVRPQSFERYADRLREVFGGIEEARRGGAERVRRVALMGAMTDGLVRWAADRGADVYVTGQLRAPAGAAVAETGIGVVAVGHRRSEEWGMRALAHVLRERWQELEVRVWDPPA